MKVEALTTAASAPDAKMRFNFRVGDKFDVTPEVYDVLSKAGAVRSLEPVAPASIKPSKGSKGGGEKGGSSSADAGDDKVEGNVDGAGEASGNEASE